MKKQITALLLAAALAAGIMPEAAAADAAADITAAEGTVSKTADVSEKAALSSFDPTDIASIRYTPKSGAYKFTAGMETRGVYDTYPEWNEDTQKMDYAYAPKVQAGDKLIINRADGKSETYIYNETAGGYLINDNNRADLIPSSNVKISFSDVENRTIPVALRTQVNGQLVTVAGADVPYTVAEPDTKDLTYKKGANGIALYGEPEYPAPFSSYDSFSANTGADVDMISMNGTVYEFWYFSSCTTKKTGTYKTQYYGCFKERNKTSGAKELLVLFEDLSGEPSDGASVAAKATFCGQAVPKGDTHIGVQRWNNVEKDAAFNTTYQVKVGKGSSIDFAVTPDRTGTYRFAFDFTKSTKGILPGVCVIDDAAYRRYQNGDDDAEYLVMSKTLTYSKAVSAEASADLIAGRRYIFHLEEGTGSRMDVSVVDPNGSKSKDVILIDAIQKTSPPTVNPGSSNAAERNTVIMGKGASKAMYKIKGQKAIYYRCLAPKNKKAVKVSNYLTLSGRSGRFYVKSIDSKAFSGRKKLRRVDIYAERLTKSGIKGCFKGLKVKTVRVYYYMVDKYDSFFTKKITKNKVKLRLKYF